MTNAVETAVEETEVKATKKKSGKAKSNGQAPKAKAKSKAKVGNTAKVAAKKSPKERKAIAAKAAPKKEGVKRTFDVGGAQWPRNKVLTLLAAQNLGKSEVTKKQILEKLTELGYSRGINADFPANKFCYELQEEGYMEVGGYEGDKNLYRQATVKGLKAKLPTVPVS